MNGGLGKRLKELRAEREWTQNELARRAGIDRSYLASIETGKVMKPNAETFLKLSRALSIHPEELYKAAGYIKEARIPYGFAENPIQLVDELELHLRQLKRLLKEER